jgi:hypothetical protein
MSVLNAISQEMQHNQYQAHNQDNVNEIAGNAGGAYIALFAMCARDELQTLRCAQSDSKGLTMTAGSCHPE